MLEINKIHHMSCVDGVKQLDDESLDCVMTSPPYWALRDYGTAEWEGGDERCDHIEIIKPGEKSLIQQQNKGSYNRQFKNVCKKCGAKRIDNQIGLESTFMEYVNKMCDVFDEIKRALKPGGTCFVNLGDTWNSGGAGSLSENTINKDSGILMSDMRKADDTLPQKCLCMVPERFAIEMCNRGWILRNTIIWFKSQCMPYSGKDRFTANFEKIFFFVKNQKYNFNQQFERSGCNKRAVWRINPARFSEAHFATYPETLIEPCIKAGCPDGGLVLDPFMGAGTTAIVAKNNNKNYIGFELSKEYIEMSERRINNCVKNHAVNITDLF